MSDKINIQSEFSYINDYFFKKSKDDIIKELIECGINEDIYNNKNNFINWFDILEDQLGLRNENSNENTNNKLNKQYENFYHDKYGYCYYYIEPNKTPIIFNLYVEPEYRGKGFAKHHLHFVINEIRKSGYHGIIDIEANPKEDSIDLKRLISFYESLGLRVINKK